MTSAITGKTTRTKTTPWVSYGVKEALHVVAVVKFIESHPTYGSANIGLLSICTGGSASTYAFGTDLKNRNNIKAMVDVQPLAYRQFLNVLSMPGFIKSMADNVNNQRMNSNMSDHSFMPFAKDRDVPTLVIQNRNDPMLDEEHVQQFFDELQVEKEMMWVEIEKRRAACYDLHGRDPTCFAGWFGKYL